MKYRTLDVHKQQVRTLIEELPLPSAIRERVLQYLPKYFFSNLGLAFSKCFPEVSEEDILIVDTATFIGAAGIYAMDGVFDIQVKGVAIQKPLIFGQFCLQESQRLLSSLFPLDSPFWNQYYQRFSDHYKELELSRKVDVNLNFERYVELLPYKYSLLYLVPDILHYLSQEKNEANYQRIQESLNWFTVGYNIPNEIRGLEMDLRTGVNNYAGWRLKNELGQLGILYAEINPEKLHQLVFSMGLAEQLLDESLEAFQKAMDLVSDLNLSVYTAIVESRIKLNKMEKSQIPELVESLV